MLVKVLLLIVFFAVMIGIGVYTRKHATDVNGFVLGSRSAGPWITAFAYGTSYFSAVVFVGYAGQFGWKYGIASTWIGLGNAILGSLLAWFVLGRRTRVMTQHIDAKTMPDYFGKRYNSDALKIAASVITFVFFFVRLIPGDPARLVAGEQATQDDVEAVREELGLNKSIPAQYVTYVTGLLKGNLGTSLRTKQPVTKEIAGRFGNTVRLAFVTLLWSSVVGVLFGVWSGTHRGKWQDYTGMTIAVSGISLPSFWIGFLLIMLFAVKLRILPTTSGTSLKSLIMPSITLGVGIAAVIARFTRSSIIEVLKEDYVRTARAKGIKENDEEITKIVTVWSVMK